MGVVPAARLGPRWWWAGSVHGLLLATPGRSSPQKVTSTFSGRGLVSLPTPAFSRVPSASLGSVVSDPSRGCAAVPFSSRLHLVSAVPEAPLQPSGCPRPTLSASLTSLRAVCWRGAGVRLSHRKLQKPAGLGRMRLQPSWCSQASGMTGPGTRRTLPKLVFLFLSVLLICCTLGDYLCTGREGW